MENISDIQKTSAQISSDPYRAMDEDDKKSLLRKKALTVKYIDVLKKTIHHRAGNDSWEVDNRGIDKYRDLSSRVRVAYQSWYQNRKHDWEKTSKEAFEYGLIDEIEECPHIDLCDESDDRILALALYFDMINDCHIEIDRVAKHGIFFWKVSWWNGESRKRFEYEDLYDALGDMLNWIKGENDRQKNRIAKEALELGVIKKSHAVVKREQSLAKRKLRKKIAAIFGWSLLVLGGGALFVRGLLEMMFRL